jgi:hypothetical protein
MRLMWRLFVVAVVLQAVGPSPTAANAAEPDYRFSRLFGVAERSNQQGLAYGGRSLWACFDTVNGGGRIVKYSRSGAVLKRSPILPLGHCAEIAYRERDGTLFAVDYVKGGSTANIRIVDMRLATPRVIRTISVTRYGLAGMIAIDNVRDRLLVFGGRSPYRFNFLSLSGTRASTKVTWRRQVTHRGGLGIPNGLEVIGDEFLFSTSIASRGAIRSNRLHVFDLQGRLKTYINVPLAREKEGLAVNRFRKKVYLGFHRPNAVYRMAPAYAPVT